MEADKLLKMWEREKGSTERSNFDSLAQTAAEWCKPESDNIEKLSAKGQRKDSNRLTDAGIKARRMFAAGMMAHLFPQGQQWIKINTSNMDLMDNDSVTRALSTATKKFVRALEESNFYEEMGKSVDDLGWSPSTSVYVESDKKTKLNFRSHGYKQFYFCNDHRGRMDTYIRDFKLTARQACGMFNSDDDKIPEQIVNMKESNPDHEYTFVNIVMPRADVDYSSADKKKKPYASYYLCADTRDTIRESGFDWMPYSIGGMYLGNNNEKYFRTPAMEVYATLGRVNRMEVTRERAAERVSSPPWLAPNDGSVRRISNDQGSIIYWNAGNPMSKPEQLNPSDNPMVNDDMISKKEEEIYEAFFIPYFNPLQGVKNISSAHETRERVDLSLQFISSAINTITKYFVKPSLETSFNIMSKDGHFPELEIPELSEASIEFELVGKAALASRQIELYGVMTGLEQMGLVGQVKPEIWDTLNADETAFFLQDVNMFPTRLRNNTDEIEKIRGERAQMVQEQRARENAGAMADAYAKTAKTPEEGSGAQEIQEQFS